MNNQTLRNLKEQRESKLWKALRAQIVNGERVPGDLLLASL